MLETKDLSFSYCQGQPFKFPDLSVSACDVLVVLGLSGTGKTTLLHLLAGLMQPSSGSVLVNSTEINELSGSERDCFRGENIGVVFQQAQFIRSISVLKNLPF